MKLPRFAISLKTLMLLILAFGAGIAFEQARNRSAGYRKIAAEFERLEREITKSADRRIEKVEECEKLAQEYRDEGNPREEARQLTMKAQYEKMGKIERQRAGEAAKAQGQYLWASYLPFLPVPKTVHIPKGF